MFVSLFWIAYFISPRFCHRFVGYLEEEAVRTYTHCIQVSSQSLTHTHTSTPPVHVQCMDEGKLPMWSKMPAPLIALNYWKLKVSINSFCMYLSTNVQSSITKSLFNSLC